MTSQEKQLTKDWKREVTYRRSKRNEEIAGLKYQLQLKNESLLNKEKSILALIDRNLELQNTIREQSISNKNLIKRIIVLKNMIENVDNLNKNNFDITKLFRIFTK